jgi:hypothetical protein
MLLEGPTDVTLICGAVTPETSSAKLVSSDEDANFFSKSSFSFRRPAKSKFNFFKKKKIKKKRNIIVKLININIVNIKFYVGKRKKLN